MVSDISGSSGPAGLSVVDMAALSVDANSSGLYTTGIGACQAIDKTGMLTSPVHSGRQNALIANAVDGASSA
ncbi:hypothetical protein ACFY8P_06765 [Streptomyces sp. NPDC012693]|uniref:hypothetical protein n=1 Tax=unclassified Streptomyces TaxID=2593676 RepID=UPI00202DC0F6|nr:hypothetical protein [Streptomyces sp. MSC1_001]